MNIFDISLTISSSLPTWPGDPLPLIEQVMQMEKGASANVSRLSMGAHVGTHVDAPHHFLNDGRMVEALALDVLVGACYVAHIPDEVDLITADVLGQCKIPTGTMRVLFHTRNSHLWRSKNSEFQKDFVAISAEGADWLVVSGFKLVGVDYLSVGPFGASVAPHRSLLTAGIILVEGLDLSEIPEGSYCLYCLPLKLADCEGAPARAILTA